MNTPLEKVSGDVYINIFLSLKDFGITFNSNTTKRKKEDTMYMLANYAYAIFTKINRKRSLEIDYSKVKEVAVKNRFLIRHVLKDYFKMPLLKFEKWMHADCDLIEIQMYKKSNAGNKHNFK